MYDAGEAVPHDETVRMFRRAANRDSYHPNFKLAVWYYKGEGVPQDDAKAVKWFRLAAEQGYYYAQFNLGSMYLKGEGVPQDKDEARKWYLQAAEQGHADAQTNLGWLYADDDGEPIQLAHMWFNLAAAQGGTKAKESRHIVAKRMTREQIADADRLSRERAGGVCEATG